MILKLLILSGFLLGTLSLLSVYLYLDGKDWYRLYYREVNRNATSPMALESAEMQHQILIARIRELEDKNTPRNEEAILLYGVCKTLDAAGAITPGSDLWDWWYAHHMPEENPHFTPPSTPIDLK